MITWYLSGKNVNLHGAVTVETAPAARDSCREAFLTIYWYRRKVSPLSQAM